MNALSTFLNFEVSIKIWVQPAHQSRDLILQNLMTFAGLGPWLTYI